MEMSMTDSQTTTMILIRHAESSPNKDLPESDWPLSSLGRCQAKVLAAELGDAGITKVASSPYLRAIDTVRPLAERVGCPIDVRNGLRERELCSGFRDDWYDLIKKAWADFAYSLPDCESSFDCQRRIQECLTDLVARYAGMTIAVCSHGNAIGLFLNSIEPSFGFAHWEDMKVPDVFWIIWRNGHPEWRIDSLKGSTEQTHAPDALPRAGDA
jgi:2,3-bisphosphoglycerate-dependent phosphoglycerate mutase